MHKAAQYAVLAASLIASFASIAQAPSITAPTEFSVEAQPLAKALNAWAKQARLQVIWPSRTPIVDRISPRVVGEYTPQEALKILLEGTGLGWDFVDAQTVAIGPASDAATRSLSKEKGEEISGDGQKVTATFSSTFRTAQEDRGASAEAPSVERGGQESVRLEEVVVTAEKREERLQDVPVPVSVINTQQLTDAGEVLIRDYYATVPGLSYSPNIGGNSTLSIRGITTGGFGTPTVGVTIDDVPFGGSTTYTSGAQVPDIDPGDLDHIEVLRGPQGTLYGANSMGGLVKYVTVDPSPKAFSGRLEAGTSGVYNGVQPGYNLRASYNLPVTDTLAVRASLYERQDPGYIDNPVYHLEGINEAKAYGARLSALWTPGEGLSLKLGAVYQRFEAGGSTDVNAVSGSSQLLQQTFLPGSSVAQREIQAYSAVLKAKLGNVNLVSITGENINRYTDGFDFSFIFKPDTQATFGASGAPLYYHGRVNSFTQEIRLSASLADRLEWLVGAYYTNQDAPVNYDVLAQDITTLQILGTYEHNAGEDRFQEYSAFATLTYGITDRFNVQLGARQSFTREHQLSGSISGPYATQFLGGSPATSAPVENNGNAFTYLLTPQLKLSPDVMAYVRLASGYRPGTGNGNVMGVPPKSNPDRTLNYEVGLKGDFLNNTLSLDTSIYYIDWRDVQINLYSAQSLLYTANGSEAKSEGVELSATARPTGSLTLSGWIVYDEAALTKAFPANSPSYGAPGDRLPNTPRFSGNVSAEQEFPLWSGATGSLGALAAYVGNRVSVFTGSALRQDFPSYTRVDLHASVKYDSWKTSLFVNNIADKRGLLQGGLGYFYPATFQYIEPRTIGLSVMKSF